MQFLFDVVWCHYKISTRSSALLWFLCLLFKGASITAFLQVDTIPAWCSSPCPHAAVVPTVRVIGRFPSQGCVFCYCSFTFTSFTFHRNGFFFASHRQAKQKLLESAPVCGSYLSSHCRQIFSPLPKYGRFPVNCLEIGEGVGFFPMVLLLLSCTATHSFALTVHTLRFLRRGLILWTVKEQD